MGRTVSKRVGELEGRMASLQEGLESVRAEVMRVQNIVKSMTGMMVRFNLLMAQWDEQERERRGSKMRKTNLRVRPCQGRECR